MKHNLFKKCLLTLGLAALSLGTLSCEDSSTIHVYASKSLAQSFSTLKGEALYNILGASVVSDNTDNGIQFAVFAKNATRVEVLIFGNEPERSTPIARIPMTKDAESGIWTQFVSGIGYGTHYGYIAFGPNWPYDPKFEPGTSIGYITDCDEDGNRYNPNKLLIDPYTRRIHRDFDWGSGNPASGTALKTSTWKAAAKSVVIKSEYEWSANEKQWRENRMKGNQFEGHSDNDLIVYEVHPLGFTKGALDLNQDVAGTWRGIGEKAEYLKELGITAVELMPVGEKPDDGTYWGYNTIAFFAPEQRFATAIDQKKTNGVHDEFKEMVDKLHQAGIEVILDVVYNHSGEGGFWRSKVASNDFDYGSQSNFDDETAATIYTFRGLDNKEYYHLTKNSQNGLNNQMYLDETGVGNQMRANNTPFKRLILDNLRFWVEEMHVDGFRFDLASILGVTEEQISQSGDGDTAGNTLEERSKYWGEHVTSTVLQDIIDDDVMAKYHTRFIAEPWSLGQYVNGLFPKSTKHEGVAWYEWNGRFRDLARPLVNYDDCRLNKQEGLAPDWQAKIDIGNILTGSSNMFGEDGRKPYHSVNFLTAHDGFTLYDLETYNSKHNDCGKLNPICCGDRYNAFCDLDSGDNNNSSRNWCISQVCWYEGDDGNWYSYSCPEDKNLANNGKCPDADDEATKRQMIRNLFTLLFISQGTPMILGGDEFMRTQFGNNNAYSDSSNNEFNWFRWSDWLSTPENVRMHDFVRDMIKLRKTYKEFLSPSEYGAPSPKWWWADGCGDTVNGCWDSKAVAIYYEATETTPKPLYIMINLEGDGDRTFYLPDGEWTILADTQKWYDNTEYLAGEGIDKKQTHNIWLDGSNTTSGTYAVKSRSIVIATK